MATPGTGEDIEDQCSKCGDVWHVVMAKVGERIARVVCKRCGSQHAYRSGTTAPANVSSMVVSGKRTTAVKKKKTSAPAPIVAPAFDASIPPRPYTMRETFAPGERIVHPTFGVGVVALTPAPGKMDVVFPEAVRTLACGKIESTLARPINVTDAPIGDRPPGAK